jgi:uroporphyrinogen decarboxylase
MPEQSPHALPPRAQWTPAAAKLRDTYARVPGAPLYQREFGFYCLERWWDEGLPRDADFAAEFGYDPPGNHGLGQLGWCEAAFVPAFPVITVEDRGSHEVYQDHAGRKLLVFKGRRDGFMPDYLDHPVKDQRTWEEDVAWRMAVDAPGRFDSEPQRMAAAQAAAAQGLMISQGLIGGYMYLRSLIGPEELLYFFHDQPALIHACLKTWFELADAVIARHQQHVTIDEIFFAEDICYNHGPLISPAMMRQFLLPYYAELIANLKRRQLDHSRHLYVQIDTDGFADPVIPVYQEIGMDVMSPFEVASGCDVVAAGRQYPGLTIFGGIDKRLLAAGREAIDAMVDRILPAMRERGGYIPTCDHGVPPEVSLADYRHYRRRCLEFA